MADPQSEEPLLPELWPSLPPPRPVASASCRPPSGRASGSSCAAPAGLTAAELIGAAVGLRDRGPVARSDLAADAIARFDGAQRPGPGERRRSSRRVPGIGAARAAQLQAAFELGRRAARRLAGRALVDPLAARRRGSARAPDGPPRARGAAGRDAEHEERRAPGRRRPTRATSSASLVRVGELFRDAVRLDAARRDPRPQPPIGRPDAVAGRPPPHRRGARGRPAARHRRARPPRHRPRRLRLSLRDRGVPFDRPGAAPRGPSVPPG